MLDFLLCEYISLGFRGGMCERKNSSRREREGGQIFFFFFLYPAGIQILRNAPLGTYFAAKTGDGSCDPPCRFPTVSLGEGFLAQGGLLAPNFDFLGCTEPLSCCHPSTALIYEFSEQLGRMRRWHKAHVLSFSICNALVHGASY